jgi:hypothetical protein
MQVARGLGRGTRPGVSDPSADERSRAIEEGLRFAGLRESQRGLVERYLDEHPDDWMNCCGSSCDPCVLTIGHAVAKARQLLGKPPL